MNTSIDEQIAMRAANDDRPLTPDEVHVSCAAAGCSEHHHAKRVRATAVDRMELNDAVNEFAALHLVMRNALGAAAEALALPTSEAGKARALAIVRDAIAKADEC